MNLDQVDYTPASSTNLARVVKQRRVDEKIKPFTGRNNATNHNFNKKFTRDCGYPLVIYFGIVPNHSAWNVAINFDVAIEKKM